MAADVEDLVDEVAEEAVVDSVAAGVAVEAEAVVEEASVAEDETSTRAHQNMCKNLANTHTHARIS